MTRACHPLTIGTAGHVDHGKTTLVRALTGVDTDRLAEEKRRGLTIELGFAELELTDGRRLSLVDVPGHERFVRTMVAGASGIDMYLLCVAADDGVMPQTREHWEVLRALGVDRGVVALTKCDRVPSQLASARAEIAELVGGAPTVEVSALRGVGLERLREAIAAVATTVPARAGGQQWPPVEPVLHVDRAFTLTGAGTVVTGTLWSGALSRGDRVKLLPSGKTARIRRVQLHGREAERAEAGGRVALNLSGVSLEEVARGDVVTGLKSSLLPTHTVDVEVTPAQPELDGARVQIHHGTRDLPGRALALVEEDALYRLRLERPLVAVPSDRLVLRRIAPAGTLGGAVVIDPAPPPLRRAAAARRLSLIRSGTAEALVEAALRECPDGIASDPSTWTAVPMLNAAHGRFSQARWQAAVREMASGRVEFRAGRLRQPVPATADDISDRAPTPRTLSPAARAALKVLQADGVKPRAPQALAEALGIDEGAVLAALEELTAAGALARLKPGIYYPSEELERLRARVLRLIEQHGSLTVAELRDQLGSGRKHAQAVLEHLNRRHDTLRRSDRHVRSGGSRDGRSSRGRQESGGSAGLQSQ